MIHFVEGYGLSHEFADSAWVKLEISNINVSFTISKNVEVDVIEVTTKRIDATACYIQNSIKVVLDSFTADSRINGELQEATTTFRLKGKDQQPVEYLKIEAENITMDFAITVGIGKESGPLVGGVKGKMAGRGAGALIDISYNDV